jgi:ATP-dependent DNA helicase RecQ
MPDGLNTPDGAQGLLKSVFGFDAFRPGQEPIVTAVAAGENVLAIMPTGGGKSLCFQLPALMRDGVMLVISPLIALMRDQVRALRASGVAAAAITSANSPEENDAIFDQIHAGALKILYIAPERLASTGAAGFWRRAGVSMIAVDEAHCVSQWGFDFRPDYLRIGALARDLRVPIAAFTATADAETRAEIKARLFGPDAAGSLGAPREFLHGFDRPNLHLAFAPKNQPRRQILAYAAARKGQAGIIYCARRKSTESLAAALCEAGHEAAPYHGGMDPEARTQVEERFALEDGLIVVATVAFGMGVDKPDIRWVMHADLPKSIESYYQEIGRAGRDGAPAQTLTLFGADDIRFRRLQIDEGLAPPPRRAADHARLNALLGLADSGTCRRQILLGYFGEDAPPCGNCDCCDKPPKMFDATEAVRMALSAVLRTGESFGAGHLIDILCGKATDRVRMRGDDKLPTFGVGKHISQSKWQGIFRKMMGQDFIRPDPERHGALRMTDPAVPILKGEETVMFREDTPVAEGPAIKMLVHEEDAPLLSALKAKRRALADAAGVPAYIIFNDRTLIEMAQKRPQIQDDMAQISGVGAKKLGLYGDAFLGVISGDTPAPTHPARRKMALSGDGAVYDALMQAQAQLRLGVDGVDKPLSCSAAQIARIVQMRPRDMAALERLLDARRAERFGTAFLEILDQAD